MLRYLTLLLIAFSLIGCENKQTKPKNVLPKIKKEKPKVYDNDEILDKRSIINQDSIVDFLKTYGEQNPETKVRLKTNLGDIDLQLFKETPLHRANFIFLVKNGYFNTTQFHRVVKDFIIQAGSSDNRKTRKMRHEIGAYKIPPEFTSKKHYKGALSAARKWEGNPKKLSDPYEFFIILKREGTHHLDQQHTVFGKVIKGLDVVDAIGKLEVDIGEWPYKEVSITTEILD